MSKYRADFWFCPSCGAQARYVIPLSGTLAKPICSTCSVTLRIRVELVMVSKRFFEKWGPILKSAFLMGGQAAVTEIVRKEALGKTKRKPRERPARKG